jgi:anti-sigma factor RsiW
MNCEDRTLDLHALLDHELHDQAANDLVRHMATCPTCAATFANLLLLRSKLARLAPVEQLDPALIGRIDAAITSSKPVQRPLRSRSWKLPALSGGLVGLAAAAMIMLMLQTGNHEAPTIRAVADAGLRQSIPMQAVSLADNRPGGADAWFGRRHLAQPPVPNLTKAGFVFAGYRTDIIAGHSASILVYQHAKSQITLIAWPADGEAAHPVRTSAVAGHAVTYWNNGTIEFWITGNQRQAVQRFTAAYRQST